MDRKNVLLGKRLLIVDDEKDTLETLIDLLSMCKIDTASSFDEAKQFIEHYEYELAVLDIMGVRGFDLLELAYKRNVPALILTAHSLNAESLTKSMREGASYFVPKEKMADIAIYAADVLEAKEGNKNPWVKWFDRLANFFDVKFTGPDWRKSQREFVEKFAKQGI